MQENNNVSLDYKIQNRLKYNKKILEAISDFMDRYPELRFWQAFYAFGYETNPDRFYDESYDTYQQIIQQLENKKDKK